MTDEQINIAITKECGLPVDLCMCGDSKSSHRLGGNEHTFTPMCDSPPNYITDLNAMRNVLLDHICGDAEKEKRFLQELNTIIERIADSEDVPVICEWDMALVAAQCDWLAEAFLRTLGKWKD